MNIFEKYLKKHEKAIILLLQKQRKNYTPETFHELRVEIKKMHAFFEVIQFCSKDFKRKKTFKPFKQIFRLAGAIRELQIEEQTLQHYFQQNRLADYKHHLKTDVSVAQKNYFSFINKCSMSKLDKKVDQTKSILKQMNKKKLNKYLKDKNKKIEGLFNQPTLPTQQLHLLRKELKKFNYNQKALKINIPSQPIITKEILPDLLGKWNDTQGVIQHIKTVIDSGNMDLEEVKQLKKVHTAITNTGKRLLDKIELTIHSRTNS